MNWFILKRLEDQINISEKLFDTYPILIYPCRIYDHGKHTGQLRPPRPDQMCKGTNWAMFNDLGVYGVPRKVKERQRWLNHFIKSIGWGHIRWRWPSLLSFNSLNPFCYSEIRTTFLCNKSKQDTALDFVITNPLISDYKKAQFDDYAKRISQTLRVFTLSLKKYLKCFAFHPGLTFSVLYSHGGFDFID